MEFKLNGTTIKPNKGCNPDYVRKALNKLKDGELLTTSKLDEVLGVKGDTIRDSVAKDLTSNWVRVGSKWLWGSEKTIKAYLAAINE